ncbi:hypothetical protein [Flavobacterium sp. W21_SRS_FM6]|uniref:hypothetical protein n=1 Tax=Flavobacterium sp. W21_SRS_FM6 TaxID=3240268 RepID=UPI003F8FD666
MTVVAKRSSGIVISCLSCFFAASPLPNDIIQVTSQKLAETYTQNPDQRLSILTEQSPPGSHLDKNGKVTGVTVELIIKFSERLNENIKIDLFPWVRALWIAQNEPNIDIVPVFNIGEVKLYLAFSNDVDPQRVLRWQHALTKVIKMAPCALCMKVFTVKNKFVD